MVICSIWTKQTELQWVTTTSCCRLLLPKKNRGSRCSASRLWAQIVPLVAETWRVDEEEAFQDTKKGIFTWMRMSRWTLFSPKEYKMQRGWRGWDQPPCRQSWELQKVYLQFLLMNGNKEMKHQDRCKDFLGRQLGINRTTVLFLDDGTRVVKWDELVSSHQVPEETRGQQWRGLAFFKLKSGEVGQQAVIPEGEEQAAEVAQTQLDPSSMATTWSQSSKGKGFSSMTTGAKEASASSSTGETSFKPEDNVFGGKGSGVSTPKQPQNEKGWKGIKSKGNYVIQDQQKGFYGGNLVGVGECWWW